MYTSECLRVALQLIMRGWCQGAQAKNRKGNRVRVCSPNAVAWCMVGAVNASAGGMKATEEILKKVTGSTALWQWNDFPTRTQSDVVVALQNAIVLAEAEEARHATT